MPALVRMRRTVGRLRSMPSRSRSNLRGGCGCSSVGGAGRLDHRVGLVVRHGVAGFTAPVPVSKCGGAFPPIGRQKSPGMAFTHPQELAARTTGSWCSKTVLSTWNLVCSMGFNVKSFID